MMDGGDGRGQACRRGTHLASRETGLETPQETVSEAWRHSGKPAPDCTHADEAGAGLVLRVLPAKLPDTERSDGYRLHTKNVYATIDTAVQTGQGLGENTARRVLLLERVSRPRYSCVAIDRAIEALQTTGSLRDADSRARRYLHSIEHRLQARRSVCTGTKGSIVRPTVFMFVPVRETQ
jgi:hypothetical protein